MSDPTRLTGFLLIAGGVLWFAIVTTGLDGTVVVPGVGGSQIASIRDVGIYLVPAALVVVGLLLLRRSSRGRAEGEA